HLVAYEFLGIAEAFAGHHAILADGDGVRQVSAECETGLPETLDVAHETERAGVGEFIAEHAGAHLECHVLAADDGRGKIDLDVEMEAGMGSQLAPAAIL